MIWIVTVILKGAAYARETIFFHLNYSFIAMLNPTLANFYERDIRKLIEELTLFKNEDDLWKTRGSVQNSSGNLVLHIIAA